MREIKFRTFVKESKRMIYGRRAMAVKMFTPNYAYLNKEVEVMQYTGLNDRNGNEIYEGDIYHMGDPNIIYTVVWHDTGLIGKQNGSSSYAGLNHWQERIEVIGNIHEG